MAPSEFALEGITPQVGRGPVPNATAPKRRAPFTREAALLTVPAILVRAPLGGQGRTPRGEITWETEVR